MSRETDDTVGELLGGCLTVILKFGFVFAFILSWMEHQSVFHTIVHAMFNWGYVIYWLCTHDSWRWF